MAPLRDMPRDLTRTTLAVLFIGGLTAASFYIIRPFLPATVWAVTLVIATWPVLLYVQKALGGKRSRAVAVMTVALLLIVALPIWMAISTILGHTQQILGLVSGIQSFQMPAPPRWLGGVPLIGGIAVERWQTLAAVDVGEVVRKVAPYAGAITQWFVGAIGNLGELFVQLLLTIAIAAVLYASGEPAAHWCGRFAHRLAGRRGQQAVRLAGQAIRAVALGVVVTAIVQSAIGGIGLAVSGVPQAAVLTAIMLMLCIAQLGPALVLLPATIWLFTMGHTIPGAVLAAISIPAITIDNVLRPFLIRRGANLPLVLILVGVIGGLLCFGMVGLFLGPVVLAVTYTLLQAWVDEDAGPDA